MPRLQIRSGNGPRLLADWQHVMRTRETASKPLVTLVPSPTVRDRLLSLGPLVNVEVVTLTDWVWSLVPKYFRRWPDHAEHVLQSVLPEAIKRHLARDIPGLYLTVIQAAIECRKQNIFPDNLDDDDVALRMTLQWLERTVFQGHLYDTVRLYEYASKHWSVLRPRATDIIFWGFVDFLPMEWRLIETMGRHHPCLVYMLGDAEPERWPPGAVVHPVENDPKPETEAIRIPEKYLVPEAVTRIVTEQRNRGMRLSDIIVVADDALAERIAAALAHRHIAVRTGPRPPYEVLTLWRILCDDKASSRSWRRLKDRYPDLRGWLDEWDAARRAVTGWDQARQLVETAAKKIPALGTLSTALNRWDALALACPAPESLMLRRELEGLALELAEAPKAEPIEAVWVVRASDAVALVGDAFLIPSEALGDFSPVADVGGVMSLALAASWRAGHAHHGRRARKVLFNASRGRLWLIGESGDRDFHTIPPTEEPKASVSSLLWYSDWFGPGAFHEQPGLAPSTISVSDLEKFGSCPRAFFFARGLKLKPWIDDPMRQWPALYGQWAHLALYYLDHDARLSVADAVERAMDTQKPPAGILDVVVRQTHYRLIANLQYVWAGIKEAREVPDQTETEVDWVWDYTVAEDPWQIKMRLDRIEHYGDHDVVVDFKTGTLANPEKVSADQLQIPLYLTAWGTRFPNRRVQGVLFGITDKNHFRAREVEGGDSLGRKTREVVDGILTRIRRGQFFPAPDPGTDPCRVCDYRALCPGNVRQMAQVKLSHHPEFRALWSEGNEKTDDEA